MKKQSDHYMKSLIVLLLCMCVCLHCAVPVSAAKPAKTGKKAAKVRFEQMMEYDKRQDDFVEYAVITGVTADKKPVWEHITDSYPCGQYDTVEEVINLGDRYIFCENGTLTALDTATGKVLWRNGDFDGVGIACCQGENGNLYLTAFQGPAFFEITPKGKTVHRIASFGNDFDWACDIEMVDGKVAVTMELGTENLQGPDGYVFHVDPDDYSVEQQRYIPQKNRVKEDSVLLGYAQGEVYPEEDNLSVFDSDISRDSIRSITFLSSMKGKTGADISEGQDGSVIFWTESVPGSDLEDLYIAAEGKVIAPKNCTGMFSGYYNLEEINFNGCFDTSEVEDMTGMFLGCRADKLDLKDFDTSSVMSMAWMFRRSAVTELDISGFNTENVTDMQGMFSHCNSLRELDLGHFDTSRVESMGSMFIQCMDLQKLDVSSFDTYFVTNMENMFYECSSLKKLDVSGFETRRVRDMGDMFYCCSSLKSLDTSNFETPAVTDMSGMFCYLNVNYLDLRGFDFSNVTDASHMFFAAEDLWDVDINQINLPANANTEMMFEYCPAFQNTREKETAEYEPSGSWSEVRVSVGGTVSFPWIFDEPVKNCTGFTVHYQITDVEYGKISGTYVLYRKTLNNNWERVGKFNVNDQSEVIKTFTFDRPISFKELAVAAPSGRQFSFNVQMWLDDWKFQN